MRLLFFLFCAFAVLSCPREPSHKEVLEPSKPRAHKAINPLLVSDHLMHEAKSYVKGKGFNTSVALLCDLQIRSGSRRFFVVDLNKNSILLAGMVTHGHCQEYLSNTIRFSNTSGSNCSSLGHFKIGGKYSGRFGTAYKLHGLDTTNSNAFNRFIVLHAHSCVPDYENVFGICKSEGCPTVSPYFLKQLEPIIDGSNTPILLWLYYGK
ncbi:MAG: hypothetical protein ACI8ZN_000966 [Bacteroidia bacterium]|jgi:hypothetical protein